MGNFPTANNKYLIGAERDYLLCPQTKGEFNLSKSGRQLQAEAEFSVRVERPGISPWDLYCPSGSVVIITAPPDLPPFQDIGDELGCRVAVPDGIKELTTGTTKPFSLHLLLRRTKRGYTFPRRIDFLTFIQGP